MVDLLESWLRHKSDMVNFEAARVICEMKNVTPAQLSKSIAGEPLFGSSDFMSERYFSFTALLVIAKACFEICCHSYTGCSCSHAPKQRGHMQCRPRKPHRRPQSQRSDVRHHHTSKGMATVSLSSSFLEFVS
jgi:hypothetical protein